MRRSRSATATVPSAKTLVTCSNAMPDMGASGSAYGHGDAGLPGRGVPGRPVVPLTGRGVGGSVGRPRSRDVAREPRARGAVRLSARLPGHLRDAGDRRRGRPRDARRRRPRPSGDRGLPVRQGVELPRPRLRGRPRARSAGPRRARRARASSAVRAGTRRSTLVADAAAGGDRPRTAARRCSRTPTWARWATSRPTSMRARFFNALGATRARAHDLRRRGDGGVLATHGVSPEVDPGALAERPLRPVLGLEPDVDRAAPVAAPARGAPRGGEARGRRPVPQPHRARGRRAPAAAAGHRRRARRWG